MPALAVNDVTLNTIDEGRGEALVLLHGLGSCGDDWALQTPAFAVDHRVVAPDLRGHGQSDKPRGPTSIAAMAADVAALLDALSIERAHVVGLSLGGLVAQRLAMAYPARVLSLALVNSFARLLTGSPRDVLRLLRRGLVSLVLPLRLSARYVARGLFPYPGQDALRRLAVQRVMANDPVAYRAVLIAIRSFDSRKDLWRIECPTLVVTGDRDGTVPRGRQHELAQGIRGARWVLLRDSGHAAPIDQPEAFNALLAGFLGDAQTASWQERTIDAHLTPAGY